MWSSKEISLVLILSVVAFVYSASTIQVSFLITGIPGVGYLFISGMALIFTIPFLFFEGRRWRFFVLTILYSLLMSFIFVNLGVFHLLRIIPMLIGTFIQDLIFASFFVFFRKKQKLLLFSILVAVEGVTFDAFLRALMYPVLMPPEFTSAYINVTTLMLPVILISGVFAGYTAFKIYNRISFRLYSEKKIE